jgi:hypothetical protein
MPTVPDVFLKATQLLHTRLHVIQVMVLHRVTDNALQVPWAQQHVPVSQT